jgi:CubicO group peptidase (beta-lactamase class C family)
MHHPGERFSYGLNTDVLGYLIEVVSGITLDEFFRKRIFEPLKMPDTHFSLPPEKQPRLAAVYNQLPGAELERWAISRMTWATLSTQRPIRMSGRTYSIREAPDWFRLSPTKGAFC